MVATLVSAVTAVAALAVVLGLVWLASRAARLGGLATRPTAANRRLAVQDTIALDGRRRVTLLRCDGRLVLLLTGGAQDVVVGWLPDPEAPP
jgi:flagellar protein FliO/FliZ